MQKSEIFIEKQRFFFKWPSGNILAWIASFLPASFFFLWNIQSPDKFSIIIWGQDHDAPRTSPKIKINQNMNEQIRYV